MKDYIVTVEETYFDATKFEIGGFYLVSYKPTFPDADEETHKCILTSATSKTLTFIYYNHKGCKTEINLTTHRIKSGRYVIEEFGDNDNLKDLYYNDAEMKVGKCYEIKIAERVFKGFCSYRDSEDITMVLYSDTGTVGAITYDPSTFGKYNDNITLIRFPSEPEIIHNSLTSGVVVKINRSELKEGRAYFKELV
jgi:hypothetical protein